MQILNDSAHNTNAKNKSVCTTQIFLDGYTLWLSKGHIDKLHLQKIPQIGAYHDKYYLVSALTYKYWLYLYITVMLITEYTTN